MGKYLEWCYTAINNTQGNAYQGPASLAPVLLLAEPKFNQGTAHSIQYHLHCLGNSGASETDTSVTCRSIF